MDSTGSEKRWISFRSHRSTKCPSESIYAGRPNASLNSSEPRREDQRPEGDLDRRQREGSRGDTERVSKDGHE